MFGPKSPSRAYPSPSYAYDVYPDGEISVGKGNANGHDPVQSRLILYADTSCGRWSTSWPWNLPTLQPALKGGVCISLLSSPTLSDRITHHHTHFGFHVDHVIFTSSQSVLIDSSLSGCAVNRTTVHETGPPCHQMPR